MKSRIASLDFLRGSAAFAVAIPHFFMARQVGMETAETISILGVEIFFVLSGYVLAPQILYVTVERPDLRNLGIFLVRRWMRTVPPYLIALTMVSIVAHQLFTADFIRYAMYLQNLFFQANSSDYYSIAWSLSVEEWFYITFPVFLMLLGRIVRYPAVPATLAFIAIVAVIRFAFADWVHWGEAVRRVVVFRLDSIAWGFLLYLVVERTSILTFLTPRRALLVLIVASIAAVMLTKALADGGAWLAFSFHLYASLFGAACIVAALAFSRVFEMSSLLTQTAFFLGRISYSIYLFHLLVLSALMTPLAGVPWQISLVTYLAATMVVASLMAVAVEAPVLSARPSYRKDQAELVGAVTERG